MQPPRLSVRFTIFLQSRRTDDNNTPNHSHHIRAHVNPKQYWWTAQFDVIGIVSLMSSAAVPMIYYGLFDHINIQKYYYAFVRRLPLPPPLPPRLLFLFSYNTSFSTTHSQPSTHADLNISGTNNSPRLLRSPPSPETTEGTSSSTASGYVRRSSSTRTGGYYTRSSDQGQGRS